MKNHLKKRQNEPSKAPTPSSAKKGSSSTNHHHVRWIPEKSTGRNCKIQSSELTGSSYDRSGYTSCTSGESTYSTYSEEPSEGSSKYSKSSRHKKEKYSRKKLRAVPMMPHQQPYFNPMYYGLPYSPHLQYPPNPMMPYMCYESNTEEVTHSEGNKPEKKNKLTEKKSCSKIVKGVTVKDKAIETMSVKRATAATQTGTSLDVNMPQNKIEKTMPTLSYSDDEFEEAEGETSDQEVPPNNNYVDSNESADTPNEPQNIIFDKSKPTNQNKRMSFQEKCRIISDRRFSYLRAVETAKIMKRHWKEALGEEGGGSDDDDRLSIESVNYGDFKKTPRTPTEYKSPKIRIEGLSVEDAEKLGKNVSNLLKMLSQLDLHELRQGYTKTKQGQECKKSTRNERIKQANAILQRILEKEDDGGHVSESLPESECDMKKSKKSVSYPFFDPSRKDSDTIKWTRKPRSQYQPFMRSRSLTEIAREVNRKPTKNRGKVKKRQNKDTALNTSKRNDQVSPYEGNSLEDKIAQFLFRLNPPSGIPRKNVLVGQLLAIVKECNIKCNMNADEARAIVKEWNDGRKVAADEFIFALTNAEEYLNILKDEKQLKITLKAWEDDYDEVRKTTPQKNRKPPKREQGVPKVSQGSRKSNRGSETNFVMQGTKTNKTKNRHKRNFKTLQQIQREVNEETLCQRRVLKRSPKQVRCYEDSVRARQKEYVSARFKLVSDTTSDEDHKRRAFVAQKLDNMIYGKKSLQNHQDTINGVQPKLRTAYTPPSTYKERVNFYPRDFKKFEIF